MGSPGVVKKVHSHMIKLGIYRSLSLQNQVLNAYVKSKEFHDAEKLFDEMIVRNMVSWNTVICGAVDCGRNQKCSLFLSFSYFRRMLCNEVGLDHITLNGLLRACIEVNDIEAGKQLHCLVGKMGFDLDRFVIAALVDFYGKCGFIEESRRVFDGALCRDVVLWNVMVSCYAQNCFAEEAFCVFNLMRLDGLQGDGFTFSSLLSLCRSFGSRELGMQIHVLVVKLCFESDIPVASAVVDMYAKNRMIYEARKCFDEMAYRNVVSWNTMIVGYGLKGDGKAAMRLLGKMFIENFCPDELTLASVLSSCGHTSAIFETIQVHAYVVKKGFQAFPSIINALINAYSKCGNITNAFKCFSLVVEPDLVTWTSIINSLAFHGLPEKSISTFEEMVSNNLRPDGIVFLGILSGCSHGGLISEGLHYFKLMTDEYRITPASEHYTCIIDLLGRAGLLEEALNVLTSMPFEPRSDTLGAFIGSCKVHGNVQLAKWAAEKLFVVEPNKRVNYSLLSDIHASYRNWSEVSRLLKRMRSSCYHKVPGQSWLEILGNN